MSKDVYGHNIGIIFSNNGSDNDKTKDYFIESFDTDHYYYLSYSQETGNNPVEISL